MISLSSFLFLPRWVFMETLDETPDEGHDFFRVHLVGCLHWSGSRRSQEAWCSSLGALSKDEEVETSRIDWSIDKTHLQQFNINQIKWVEMGSELKNDSNLFFSEFFKSFCIFLKFHILLSPICSQETSRWIWRGRTQHNRNNKKTSYFYHTLSSRDETLPVRVMTIGLFRPMTSLLPTIQCFPRWKPR